MKSRKTAAFLALFLGAFGVHRFYLGQTGLGIFYFFANFFTPLLKLPLGFILGMIDAMSFFFMSDEEFDRKYNKNVDRTQVVERRQTARERNRARRRPAAERVTKQRARKTKVSRRNPFKLSGSKKLGEYDLKGAIEDLKRSIDINPDDPEVHYMLASAYSLSEKADEAYTHLTTAVAQGFKDYEKIKNDDALAFLRIHEDFEAFEKAGYRKTTPIESLENNPTSNETLLAQLQRLAEMRKNGLITDEDFELEKRRIMR
jgi:TM2 domain-containing membrane protein YozV